MRTKVISFAALAAMMSTGTFGRSGPVQYQIKSKSASAEGKHEPGTPERKRWLQKQARKRNRKHKSSDAIRCHSCGRFVNTKTGNHHFIPDNHFGPEECWWECSKC